MNRLAAALGAATVLVIGSAPTTLAVASTLPAMPLVAGLPTIDDPIGGPNSGPTQSWSVRPTPTDAEPDRSSFFFDAAPGETVQDSFRVRNLGERELPLRIYATDAKNTPTGSLVLLSAAESPTDIGTWITFDRTKNVELEAAGATVTIRPLAFVDLPFTLKVPASAEPGDHTGGILSSFLAPGSDANGQAVTLDRRLASRVALRVDGPLAPGLTISDLSTSYGGALNPAGRGSTDISYRVTNDGNVRLSATQIAKASGPLGLGARTATLQPIPELLPGNSIIVTSTLSGVWPTVRTSTKVVLRPISTRPGDEFPALSAAEASAGDWAVPWSLLVLLLAAGSSCAGIVLAKRAVKAREQNRIDTAVAAKLRETAPAAASPELVGATGPVRRNDQVRVSEGLFAPADGPPAAHTQARARDEAPTQHLPPVDRPPVAPPADRPRRVGGKRTPPSSPEEA
jgi:hypothetical protein